MINKKIKIGVLGGSFDPAHKGHLAISKEAKKRFDLKKIIWAITKKNPLKKESGTSLLKRTQNCKKIIGSNSFIKIKSVFIRKKLLLIEDAAESLGSHVNKKMIGTFGDMAIFSFAGNKVMTTGEGGAVIVNSKKTYEKLKLIRSHGRQINSNYFQTNEVLNTDDLIYCFLKSSSI
mgnify:CR=1 FL=1